MNNYNFDELTLRRGTSSYKWDTEKDPEVIPLWVADMDFRTAPAVTEALFRRVRDGIFGYVSVPESYYDSLIDWFGRKHGWEIAKESIIYTSGVVPAISAIIKALCRPEDGVIIQTPAYNCFYSSIRNNGCRIIENPLRREDGKHGFTYKFDFDDLRQKASDPNTTTMILCNPHNPTGRVWTKEELSEVKNICAENNVAIISDEIHCELTRIGIEYTPYATIDSSAVICCSPSKAFNIAGLQIANIIAPIESQRDKIDRAININEVCDVNPFGVDALQAAYNHGEEWLIELRRYIDENYRFLLEFLSLKLPNIKICNSEATYLAWIDIRELGITSDEVERIALNQGKVHINSGTMYGGNGYIRINMACPRRRLKEGLQRFCQALENI